jgi:hypothetical protein
MLSLAQAAKAAGKSKPTVQRAIKAGKLSALRRDDGSYEIDPAELARVFPVLAGDSTGSMKRDEPLNGAGPDPVMLGEVAGLRALLAERESRIGELTARNAELRSDKDARIVELVADKEDLRRRLDQATALLTDQRPAAEATAPDPPRTRWARFVAWRRWP